jgi:RNA polymerase sporulation-specific sigma factor
MIGSEVRRELEDKIQGVLSPFEKQVFTDLVEGYDYKYIALKTGRSAKSVDNCIQRIRKKVKDIIKERA